MSVVIRHHASGMTPEQYTTVSTSTTDSLRAAKGFIAHYAFAEGDGVTVSEIWETQGDHDAFFDEVIRPKLPQEMPPPKVFKVINTIAS